MGRFGKMTLAACMTLAAASASSGNSDYAIVTVTELNDIQATDIVAARHAAMMMSGANLAAMKGIIDRGEDVKTGSFAAAGLAAWARAIPGMFPAGSKTPGSKAKAEIWTDWSTFNAIATQFADDAEQLRVLAKAGDAAGFAAQWAKTRENCAACHDRFKSE